MRILHLLPELNLGGVERHVLDLTARQVRRHDVTVVSAGGALQSELDPAVRHITLDVARKNLFTALSAARRLRVLAREYRWQIAHAHSRVPLWCAWFARSVFDALVMTCHATYSLNAGLWPLRRISGAICISHTVADHLRLWLPSRTAVIYNGVAEPAIPWTGAHRSRLLFVGRLSKVKGLDLALRALSRQTVPFTLDVAGDGPCFEQWRDLADDLGLADRVRWHGACSEIRVEELMASSGALIVPSLQEGWSLVRCKAALLGLPLLLSDIGANREAVTDGSVLVPCGDEEAWRIALARWLNEGRGAAELKPSVLVTPESQARATEEFYRQILGPLCS